VLGACGDNIVPQHTDAAVDLDAPDALPPAAAPDLRFHWVGESSAFQEAQSINIGFLAGAGTELSHTAPSQFSWTPLQLTVTGLVAGSYSWNIADFTPPEQIETMLAVGKAGPIASLDADLAPHLDGHEVLVSIDILPDAYAFVTNGTLAGTPAYSSTKIDIARAQLDAKVASEAAAGRVVTAVSASPIAGMVRIYSFGRDGDSTAYETKVLNATNTTLGSQSMVLATGGYIITGFGRVGTNSMILIGTRTTGAAARTVTVQLLPANSGPDLLAGDAVVAWIFQTPKDIVIVER
jgi:hypothetical protein